MSNKTVNSVSVIVISTDKKWKTGNFQVMNLI